jgi:hypothetical protein
MVRAIGIFDLPAFVPGGRVGADQFKYEIRIADGDREHSVSFVDDDSPETAALRGLVHALTSGGR